MKIRSLKYQCLIKYKVSIMFCELKLLRVDTKELSKNKAKQSYFTFRVHGFKSHCCKNVFKFFMVTQPIVLALGCPPDVEAYFYC